MFKCLVDCADLDLVNDCTATDAAERRYPGQREASVAHQQQASVATGESARRGEEEVEGEEEDSIGEGEDEDLPYDEGDINSVDVSEHLL